MFASLLKGQSNAHPLTIPKMMSSAPVSQLSMLFGIRGVAFAISSACASSAHAIAEAAHMIRAGRTKVGDRRRRRRQPRLRSLGTPGGRFASWRRTPAGPSPSTRKGMVLGEGAASLVLEDLDHARARGATDLCRDHRDRQLVGRRPPDRAQRRRRRPPPCARAYADAGMASDTPVIVSAHGIGTPLNDKIETEVMRGVLGGALDRHRVIATKSAHGHLLGAGGAIGFLLGVLALRERVAPADPGLPRPRPGVRPAAGAGRGATLRSRRAGLQRLRLRRPELGADRAGPLSPRPAPAGKPLPLIPAKASLLPLREKVASEGGCG